MATIIRYVQSIALVTWVGGIFFLGAIAAPAAFAMMSTRTEAGALVGIMLGRLHLLGGVAGVVFLVCAVLLEKSPAALARPAALLVIVMLLLTAVNQFGVNPRLAHLRAQMTNEFGNVDNTPPGNPMRVQFGKIHGVSTIVELIVLLAGAGAILFTVREGPR